MRTHAAQAAAEPCKQCQQRCTIKQPGALHTGGTFIMPTMVHLGTHMLVCCLLCQAFWWAIVTLMTVGYGDAVPLSPAGKVVAGCAMLTGEHLPCPALALPCGCWLSAALLRRSHAHHRESH